MVRGSRLAAALDQALAAALGALVACPVCGARPAGSRGCCAACRVRALTPGLAGDRLWLGPYEGALGRAVRALKYRGATRLAGWLGSELAARASAASWAPTVVCEVPLHAGRRRQRGYNQAALLAEHVARGLGVPHRPVLSRPFATAPQARLGREERRANVSGAFVGRPVAGHRVLLVDDVLTTGATLDACTAALRAAGAARVYAAVVARARVAGPPEPRGPARPQAAAAVRTTPGAPS